MQTLIRVGCCARMRRGIPCRTFRGRDASRHIASVGRREGQTRADGGRSEPMRIACDVLPPTVSITTHTLTCGAKPNGRATRPGRRSVEAAGASMPALEPTLVAASRRGTHAALHARVGRRRGSAAWHPSNRCTVLQGWTAAARPRRR